MQPEAKIWPRSSLACKRTRVDLQFQMILGRGYHRLALWVSMPQPPRMPLNLWLHCLPTNWSYGLPWRPIGSRWVTSQQQLVSVHHLTLGTCHSFKHLCIQFYNALVKQLVLVDVLCGCQGFTLLSVGPCLQRASLREEGGIGRAPSARRELPLLENTWRSSNHELSTTITAGLSLASRKISRPLGDRRFRASLQSITGPRT